MNKVESKDFLKKTKDEKRRIFFSLQEASTFEDYFNDTFK
jgi:2-oxoglutarate dehydrogenase complex dehydrogenase (E1) component-like enzyme